MTSTVSREPAWSHCIAGVAGGRENANVSQGQTQCLMQRLAQGRPLLSLGVSSLPTVYSCCH